MQLDENKSATSTEFPRISPFQSIGACVLLSVIYVASLYIWKSKLDRNHPEVIKKRFLSVGIMMLVSPLFPWLISSREFLTQIPLMQAMGFRWSGSLVALLVPLLLTMLLFLGPISVQISTGQWRRYLDTRYWKYNFRDLAWIRNHLVAPLSEEFTFRACMMPLLMQSFGPSVALLVTPLFFGIAHFHHLIEHLRQGMKKSLAIQMSLVQFTYTSVFGIYSAYLFLRTGHFVAPFIAHAFCNHMGLPDVQELFSQPEERKQLLIKLYVGGLVGWIVLLPLVTSPSWYANDLYWSKIALVRA